MPLSNSATTYGAVTKTFHWLTALLILALFALGIVASNIADAITAAEGGGSQRQIEWATLLFSLHKTIGVTVFFVALARILWAITQTKPGLLNGDNWLESRAAETVHWLLYGSLVAVPLSGWVHHAASTGFAPIWWPLGQGLPFVPKSGALSELSGTVHYILQWVLAGAIGAHIAGAIKHHVVDGDATLRRMLPGAVSAQPTAQQPGHALPFVAALLIWAAALAGAAGLGWFSHSSATGEIAALEEAPSDWRVETGTLEIEITQMGSTITGSFDDWTANISFDSDMLSAGERGRVDVTVAIRSLTLGSVTEQAMGPDYFDAATFPTASFEATLIREEAGMVADGTLRIRDQEVPVRLPFDLAVESGAASASGSITVDRRAFNIGNGVTDEGSLAFAVAIRFALKAVRAE